MNSDKHFLLEKPFQERSVLTVCVQAIFCKQDMSYGILGVWLLLVVVAWPLIFLEGGCVTCVVHLAKLMLVLAKYDYVYVTS